MQNFYCTDCLGSYNKSRALTGCISFNTNFVLPACGDKFCQIWSHLQRRNTVHCVISGFRRDANVTFAVLGMLRGIDWLFTDVSVPSSMVRLQVP